jgi:hypothetical protein
VTHPAQCLGNQWHTGMQFGAVFQCPLPHGRSSRNETIVRGDGSKFLKTMNIHQQRWTGEPHGHHRHKALAAGQQLGIAAMLIQQFQRLGKFLRAHVLERGRLHLETPLKAAARKSVAVADA